MSSECLSSRTDPSRPTECRASGPLYFPARISRSACAACASASSSVSVTTQFSFGPYFFSRSRYIFVSSVDDTSRRWISGASDVIGRNAQVFDRRRSRRRRCERDLDLRAGRRRTVRFLAWKIWMKRDRRLGIERDVELAQLLERREVSPDAGGSCLFFGFGEIDAEDLFGAIERRRIDSRRRLRLLSRECRSGEAAGDRGRNRREKSPALHTSRPHPIVHLPLHETAQLRYRRRARRSLLALTLSSYFCLKPAGMSRSDAATDV